MTDKEIEAKFLMYAQELAVQADIIRDMLAAYREAAQQWKLTRKALRRFVKEMRGDDKDDWWRGAGDDA